MAVHSYRIFTMPGCDKCADAKKYLGDMDMEGIIHDLASREGLEEFRSYYKNLKGKLKRNEDGSLPVPTILFLDKEENVASIAHSVEQLKDILQ